MNRLKKVLNNTIIGIVIVLFAMGIIIPVEGQDLLTKKEEDFINKSLPIKAASIDGGAPLHYRDSKGEIRGIAVNVLKEISNKSGLIFEYELYDSIEEVLGSDADVFFGMSQHYAPEGVTLSKTYLEAETILFMKESLDPKDLQDKVYASIEGGSLPEGVEEKNTIYFANREATLDAVEKGIADYGYGNAYSVAFYTIQNGYKNIVTIPKGKEIREYCIGVPGGNEVLLSVINKSIDAIDDNQMQTLILDVASHIERKVNFHMVMDTYGGAIVVIFTLVTILLLYSFISSINSNKKLKLQNKKYETLSHISNEYLYSYILKTDELILSERIGRLFDVGQNFKETINLFKKAILNTELIPEELITNIDNEEEKSVQWETKPTYMRYSLEGDIDSYIVEVRLPLQAGDMGVFKAINMIVKDDKGIVDSIVGKLVDISKEAKEREALIEKTQKDGLTKLYNAVTTKQLISKRMKNKANKGKDALIIIDCDNFKKINDTFGHLKGDEALENISKALKDTFRRTDIVGRIGGDEFCVYMKDIPSVEFARFKSQQLSNLIKEKNPDCHNSVSIGIALWDEEKTYEELFSKADWALYQAKKEGGAEIVVYHNNIHRKEQ